MINNPYVKAARNRGFRVASSKFSFGGAKVPKAESLNKESFDKFTETQFDIMLDYIDRFDENASSDSLLACQNAVFVITQLIDKSLQANVGQSKTSLEGFRAEFNRWAALWKRYDILMADFERMFKK